MNAVERIYKAMSHESFGKTLAKMSTEELESFIGNNLEACAPWEEFNPRGVYIFLNIDENEQAMSCGYLGTPAKSVYEAAINDRWTQAYFLSERLPEIEDLEVGTIFVQTGEDESVWTVGVQVSTGEWEIAGQYGIHSSSSIKTMLRAGSDENSVSTEVKFYLDGQEVDVEVKK